MFIHSEKVQGSNALGARGLWSLPVFHLEVGWIDCLYLFKSFVSALPLPVWISFRGLHTPPPSKSIHAKLINSGSTTDALQIEPPSGFQVSLCEPFIMTMKYSSRWKCERERLSLQAWDEPLTCPIASCLKAAELFSSWKLGFPKMSLKWVQFHFKMRHSRCRYRFSIQVFSYSVQLD